MMTEQLIQKAGPPVTAVGVTTGFVATAMPILQVTGAVIGVLVGIATLTYYVLMVIEKIEARRAKKK